ncbi:MAG: DNA polymerase-1, partial [Pseudomonadales bacterium]
MMEKQSTSPLVLVDGSSYLFRAFHGLPPLTNSKGQDTGAIYGVVNMLRSLMSTYKPSHIAVVFDAKGKTFRDDIYKEYKANRPPMPDELRSQIAPLHQIVKAMGFPIIVESGVEADDVIGTLARQASAQGIECVISTGDKDMAQLVDEHVTLINTMTNTAMDKNGVVEKFGVPAELIIDYLAMKGDKVDNIPGIPGVGDKSAVAMLNGIGGVKDIYANLDKIATLEFRGAKTMGAKIAQYEEQALLSYELATIECELKLEYEPTTLNMGEINKPELQVLFAEYEFKRWLSEVSDGAVNEFSAKSRSPVSSSHSSDTSLDNAAPLSADGESVAPQDNQENTSSQSFDRTKYEVVTTQLQLDNWISKINAAQYYAIDTETTNIDYMQAELVGFSFSTSENQACYIPV